MTKRSTVITTKRIAGLELGESSRSEGCASRDADRISEVDYDFREPSRPQKLTGN